MDKYETQLNREYIALKFARQPPFNEQQSRINEINETTLSIQRFAAGNPTLTNEHIREMGFFVDWTNHLFC